MKIISRWLLIILFCTLVVACGGNEEPAAPTEAPAASTEAPAAPTEAPIEAPTEAPIEAPTEAPSEPTQEVEETGGTETEPQESASEETTTMDNMAAIINLDYFDSAGQVSDPEIVDCNLQNGTATQCAQFVVKYLPDSLQIGPFCPENIFEDVGGIWEWDGDNPGVYRLNEAFFTMLTAQGFEFYDADGNVYIGDPAGSIQAGVNNCLEAVADDTVEMTAIIPLQPVMADAPTPLGTVAQVGLAIDSVPIFADAPSVLDRGHLPALDTCGGHIDPGGWYHWHATTTDIESSYEHEGVEADCHLEQDASALFGYAFDGYPIYGSMDQDSSIPTDLDACNGHTGATADYPDGVYHYHAGLEFPNLPTCLMGVSADNAFATTASAGIGAAGGRGPGGGGAGGGRPDFAAAAEILGVTEQELMDALGGPPPDFEAAADTLGISAEEIEAAVEGSRGGEGGPPPPQGNGREGEEAVSESSSSFQLEAWADNWFAAYLGDSLIVEDSVSITTERSFNAETATFEASYPLNLNFILKDFKENDTGLEYIGSNRQQMGDGGFIMQLTDTSTGNVVAVSDDSFACTVIHTAPLDKSCESESDPVAGAGACTFSDLGEPSGWMSGAYDDSAWTATTIHTSADVDPKQGYDDISWDSSAQFIWGPDLETNNTILCRMTVEAP